MKAIFVVVYGGSAHAVDGEKVERVAQELYGKDVYVQFCGETHTHEQTIQSIARTSTIESIEDKVVEIGPYLVKYKLVKTT